MPVPADPGVSAVPVSSRRRPDSRMGGDGARPADIPGMGDIARVGAGRGIAVSGGGEIVPAIGARIMAGKAVVRCREGMAAVGVAPPETGEMAAAKSTGVAATATEVATTARSVAAPAAAAAPAMLRQSQSWRSRYGDSEQQGTRGSHYISQRRCTHNNCTHNNHPVFSRALLARARVGIPIRPPAAIAVQAHTYQNAVTPATVDRCHKLSRP